MTSLETRPNKLLPIPPANFWVTSDNFLNYLFSHKLARPDHFARHLNLAFLTPAIEELYAKHQPVYVHTEELRQTAANFLTGQDASSPATGIEETIDELRQSFVDLASKKRPGERMLTMFYDPTDDLIKYSDIKFGEIDHVQNTTLDVIKDNKTPLLDMHTHPDDTLFSPIDYAVLLNLLYKPAALVNASLVLCPGLQVLALATNQTSIKEVQEINTILDEWTQEFTHRYSLRRNTLENRWQTTGSYHSHKYVAIFTNTKDQIVHLLKDAETGIISQPAALELAKEAQNQGLQQAQTLNEKYSRVNLKATVKWANFIRKTENEVRLDFARQMGIKLYISANMRDFLHFSA